MIPELDRTLRPQKDGSFTVELQAGQYTVIVSAKGLRTQKKKIRVISGDTVIFNVELHP